MAFLKQLKKQAVAIISITLVIISIIAMLMVFNHNIEENIEVEMQSYLEEISDNAVYILNNEIDKFIGYLENEARTFSLLGNLSDEDILTELKNFPKDEFMPRVNIMTLDGRVYSSLDGSIRQFDPDDYKEALERKKVGISQPRFSDTLKCTIVEVATPLYLNGIYSGILIGNYDIGNFEKLFTSNFLDGDCEFSIVTANGDIVSHGGNIESPKALKGNIFEFYFSEDVKFIEGTPDQIKCDISNGKGGYKAYINKGSTRYVSYIPVGVNDWYITCVSTEKTSIARTANIKRFASTLVIGVVAVMVVLLIVIILTRAKEQMTQREELKKLARIDSLTGLFNKATTEREIDDFLKKDGHDAEHAFLMVDIDGFKGANDELGHAKGDEILMDFGLGLQDSFGDKNILGRIGGDEFVVFIKNYNDIDSLVDASEKIRDLFRKIHFLRDQNDKFAKTSASIGIAIYKKDGESFGELYHNADIALYDSKNSGKDQYKFFSSEDYK